MSRIARLALLSIVVVTASVGAVNAFSQAFATPPRLSLVNGPVSFWRQGMPTWRTAMLNTPLAPGDAIATSESANAEVQIGAYAWLRAANATEFSITANQAELTVITLSNGIASIDARDLSPGRAIDVVTANTRVAIRTPGYYRISAAADGTSVTVRRGGYAQVTSTQTRASTLRSGELALFQYSDQGAARLFGAPAEDEWDRWNYSRSETLANSISARHASPEIYGLAELDRNGSWQDTEDYGPLWIPATVPFGWTPFSAGRWIDDPVYGQTWLDDASWGYATFHYGRWIDLGGRWGWAPGPRAQRPAYAPAYNTGHFNDRSTYVTSRQERFRVGGVDGGHVMSGALPVQQPAGQLAGRKHASVAFASASVAISQPVPPMATIGHFPHPAWRDSRVREAGDAQDRDNRAPYRHEQPKVAQAAPVSTPVANATFTRAQAAPLLQPATQIAPPVATQPLRNAVPTPPQAATFSRHERHGEPAERGTTSPRPPAVGAAPGNRPQRSADRSPETTGRR